jgi:heterodisulfide reductase subunit C/nitrate reductase gamma subunit
MFFRITLDLSLAVFLLGTIYQVGKWFQVRIGPDAGRLSPVQRVLAAVRGILPVLFGRRVFSLAHALVFHVFLQTRTLRRDVLRWVAHILIFYGFLLLVLMHALDRTVTATLFPDYQPTLNPFFFLRNLFGVLVLLGVFLAAFRRIQRGRPALFTRFSDLAALAALAVILISGFLLEGAKMISAPAFDAMVDEYAPTAEAQEVRALQEHWARNFGVIFPGPGSPGDPEILEQGREVHETSCASCHDRPESAFVSFSLARALAPAAPLLNRFRADRWLLPVHFLSCFLALALLPFTKFFHLLATPAGLLTHAALNPASVLPGNLATRRALALDACTHCGDCTEHCSVAPLFRRIPNPDILPSEKLLSIRELARGKKRSPEAMQALAEGSFLCTRCFRCTTICPSGLYLQDLWIASTADLADRGFPEPHVRVKQKNTAEWAEQIRYHGDAFPVHRKMAERHRNLSDRSETFEACIQCQTCTNVCPVVAWSPNPDRDVGITPQQIMNLLRIGLKELTLGSPMVWDCVTCYLCQEHCPEGIRVTDILYELRSLAYEKFRALPPVDPGPGQGEPAGHPASEKGMS